VSALAQVPAGVRARLVDHAVRTVERLPGDHRGLLYLPGGRSIACSQEAAAAIYRHAEAAADSWLAGLAAMALVPAT
jgi:hypothetical protein